MTPLKRYSWAYWTLLILIAGLFLNSQPMAHEVRPALLEINEREAGWFDVVWKVPTRGGKVLAITPILPDSLTPVGPPSARVVPGAKIERVVYRGKAGSLTGETISIDGLSALQIDVLLQIALADGTAHSAILRPTSPTYLVPKKSSNFEVAQSYWMMGVEHILGGADHLLFVLALILIIPNYWNLLKAITAFTVAHSITLALATLGYVHMPAAPTEAVIALSILFLSVEIVRSHEGKMGLTERAPWIIAFLFGLFHGLGFAGALSDVGLPQHAIPLALLMFNIGVECGQILFVLFVLAVVAAMRQLQIVWPAGSWRVFPYAIGSLAAFWTFQRVGSFW